MKYILIDSEGKIHSLISCPESMVDAQIHRGLEAVSVSDDLDILRNRYDRASGMVVSMELSPDELWDRAKVSRNIKLTDTDFWELPSQSSNLNYAARMQYRQELRDITLQSDPSNIVFPTPPA